MVLDKKSQMLHSANLGDSGFLVIRQGSVVHQSSEMQHYFNTPYQLAIPPPGQAGTVIEDRYVWLLGKGWCQGKVDKYSQSSKLVDLIIILLLYFTCTCEVEHLRVTKTEHSFNEAK